MSAESQRERTTDDDQQLEHVTILGWRGRQNQLGPVLARVRVSSDPVSAALANALYQGLLAGDTLASALHRARLVTMSDSDITPLYILMAGYPNLRLVEPSKRMLPGRRRRSLP